MSKVLCLCGKQGSGKNTLSNFLHGYQLTAYGKIQEFDLTDGGELLVSAPDENGNSVSVLLNLGDLDNIEMAEWFAFNMWPFVKQYSFAEALKEICTKLFDIEKHKVYGTQAQKAELTHLKWCDMPGAPDNPNVYISSREFMQFFGTEIMRKIYPDIWTNHTTRQIKNEGSQLSIITDGRFKNELDAVKSIGGKSIYLTRKINEDGHQSEVDISHSDCDAVIDNANMSVVETCQKLLDILNGWGWTGDN